MPEKSKASMLDEDIEKPKNGMELQDERERLRRRRLLSFDETGNIFYSVVCVVLLIVEYSLWIQVQV
jgi:hypothetical protein